MNPVVVGAVLAAAALTMQACTSPPSAADLQRRDYDRAVLTLQRIREAVERELGTYKKPAQDAITPPLVMMSTGGTIKLEGFDTPLEKSELHENCLKALTELRRIEEVARRDPLLSRFGCQILIMRGEATILRTLTGVAYAMWETTGSPRPPEAADLNILAYQERSARGP